MQVQNAQVEEPKIVEEARNKQKEKRSEALEKVDLAITKVLFTLSVKRRAHQVHGAAGQSAEGAEDAN